MNRAYGKHKDKQLATLMVAGLYLLLPFVIVKYAITESIQAVTNVIVEVQYAFKGGFRKATRDAYNEMLDHLAGRRARRERDRQRVTASSL